MNTDVIGARNTAAKNVPMPSALDRIAYAAQQTARVDRRTGPERTAGRAEGPERGAQPWELPVPSSQGVCVVSPSVPFLPRRR